MRALIATDALAPKIVPRTLLRLSQSDLFAVSLVTLCVGLIYGARLDLQPLVGEETRWGTSAQEMLASGDWIVPRQQGQVFPERPPMTMWLMAVAGWARGEVDPVAVRLPSVVAVVLTSLLIYVYARTLISRTTAFVAALAYPTFGQVLQIGRLGESEAVFALFVSASLLLWHLGYVRGWRPLAVWSIGFACTALAALVKGPQAPVYFGAIVGVYLLVRRDWRYLLQWQTAAGALLFAAIVAAWQIPFYRATDLSAVVATWTGLAGDRIRLAGVLSHAVTYPVETLACLLPWSPMLIALGRRGAREMLADNNQVVTFLLTAIVVAYPTVWLATGARGRYFMPIYPLVAVLIGLLVERCSTATLGSSQRRGWQQFTLAWGLIVAVGAIVVGGVGLLPSQLNQAIYQPRSFCLLFAAGAVAAAAILWLNYRRPALFGPWSAVLAIVAVAGLSVSGAMVNVNTSRWNDPANFIVEVKALLPTDASLVSLTPIDHRFAYYYRTPITELDWPRTPADLPPNVDYFCFMRHVTDTAESRRAGRGRTWITTPGTLPFAWEELKATSVDRKTDTETATIVVFGRVVRPLRAEISDATVPQLRTAERTASTRRQ
jgi:4-amino-4-deoxy-L-arabinose transferase-like glycosyltransferase